MNIGEKYSKTGTGVKFPLQLAQGSVVLTSGIELIEQSMADILSAESSPFFLGEYRNKLKDLKFEPTDEVLLSLLYNFITEALKTWEKRTKLLSLKFNVKRDDFIECSVLYQILGETGTNTFIYPFYKRIIF